jgi:flagellin
MALTVNTNIASLAIQKNLNTAADAQATAMERIGSGLRINSAKDDAAGLQIASRLNMQITGLTAAKRNANDAISIAQTAEGALQESTSLLYRMRELTISALKDNLTAEDRGSLNKEFVQLSDELTRIAESTKFGLGLKLLDGSAGDMSFQVGANIGESERITLSLNRGFGAKSLFTASKDEAAVVGDATTTGSRAVTAGEHIKHSIDGNGVRNQVTTLKVTDAIKKDAVDATDKLGVAQEAVDKTDPADQGYGALVTARDTAKTAADTATKALTDAQDSDKAQIQLNRQAMNDNIGAAAIAIEEALKIINSARADLGAKQNRLASSIRNMDNIIQNASASRGRIQDVDYAAETAELTKQQVLQQASTAILAQANQLPASILKLLQ